jgi:hypothetical protein
VRCCGQAIMTKLSLSKLLVRQVILLRSFGVAQRIPGPASPIPTPSRTQPGEPFAIEGYDERYKATQSLREYSTITHLCLGAINRAMHTSTSQLPEIRVASID